MVYFLDYESMLHFKKFIIVFLIYYLILITNNKNKIFKLTRHSIKSCRGIKHYRNWYLLDLESSVGKYVNKMSLKYE